MYIEQFDFDPSRKDREELEALKAAKESHAQHVNARLKQPIDDMPKFLRQLLTELRHSGRINSIYALGLILFAVALAIQGRIKGRTPNGSLADPNCMFEFIGPPGSGKTRTTNHILQGNFANETKRKLKFKQDRDEHIANKANLRLRKKSLEREYMLKTISEARKLEIEAEIAEISIKLARPFPSNSCHIINSATKSGMIKRLNENNGVLTVIATEGFELLKNCMVNGASFLSEMYDNNPYSRSTTENGLVEIENVVFNMLFSVQNGIAQKQHRLHAERWNECGFMARMYSIIYEHNLEGGLKDDGHHSEVYFNLFLKKIEQLYQRTETDEITVLELSEDLSEKMLVWFSQYPIGNPHFTDPACFMDRIELHTVKLSVILTLLEDPQAVEISEKAFLSARYLFDYFMEMQHIIAFEERVYNGDSIAKDAATLLKSLENFTQSTNSKFCNNSQILARAPGHRRSADLTQPLLDFLVATKKIRQSTEAYRYGYYLL